MQHQLGQLFQNQISAVELLSLEPESSVSDLVKKGNASALHQKESFDLALRM